MEKVMQNGDEALVVSDENGNYFAIPVGDLESMKASGEQKAEIERVLGDSVSGYSMQSAYMIEKLARQDQSTRLEDAARERMIRASRSSQAEGEIGSKTEGGEESATGWGGFFTGRILSLSFLKRT